MAKAIIYTRQSKHKDDSVTHEIQELEAREYAAKHDLTVVEVINEKGQSGRTIDKRPEFQRVVMMVKGGEVDILLLWKWSRFARNSLDGLITVKAIEEAGGQVQSAVDTIDRSTAMGKFSLNMVLNIAQLESDQKSEEWKRHLDYRLGKALPPAGRTYWGYTRTERDKRAGIEERYEPNGHAPLIREGMKKIVAGESMRSVAHWLNDKGVRSPLGKTIYPNKLRDMYSNPFLRGRINWKGEEVEGAHEAIISEGLYSDFLAKVAEHKEAPKRGIPAHRLVGLVICSKCGKRMSYYGAKKDRPNSEAIFRCATRVAKGAGECDGKSVKVEALENALLWWMPRHQQDIEKAAPKQDDLTARIADKDAEAERLQAKLTETLTIGREAGLTAAQMTDALTGIREQIEAVKTEAAALRTQVVISQRHFWDVEDIVHGEDVTKSRETLKKILVSINHDDVAETLTFHPTIGDPYTWRLKTGPRPTSGWE